MRRVTVGHPDFGSYPGIREKITGVDFTFPHFCQEKENPLP